MKNDAKGMSNHDHAEVPVFVGTICGIRVFTAPWGLDVYRTIDSFSQYALQLYPHYEHPPDLTITPRSHEALDEDNERLRKALLGPPLFAQPKNP